MSTTLNFNFSEGPGASLNKKQRRQLGGLEGSLPTDLLPVRATHSSGSLALDLELKITPTSNPLDLTDDHFRAMLTAHRLRRNKREVKKFVCLGYSCFFVSCYFRNM